jgi:hypothetical protein
VIIDFDTRNCPFCNEAVIAKWFANSSLPLGNKIITIDRFSGDTRTRFLEKMEEHYGGSYVLPLMLFLKKESKFVVYSVLDFLHLKSFIKEQENLL